MLEADLKVALFTRHGRGMVLTAAGETLLTRAMSIFRELDAARNEVVTGATDVTGRVVLGTPPTVGDAMTARLIERFVQQYPGVSLRIVPAFSGYLLDWLQRGEIDLAVMYEPDGRHPLKCETLLEETLCVVAGKRDKARVDQTMSLARVLDQRLILPGPSHGLRKLIERASLKLDKSPDIVVEADSLQTMKDLVERGLGMTILPFASVHREVAARRLIAARIIAPKLSRTLVVAEAVGRQSSRAARLFRDMLIAEVQDLVRTKAWVGTSLPR
jgi:DNA-binding transcriptional LysR family regulator